MAENSTYIGIIASVRAEADIIIDRLEEKRVGTFPFFAGKLSGRRVLLAISGMGKVNAAHAATFLALKHRPSLIINMGIGGAYPSSGLRIGDIAIAEKEIYGDEGVILEDGFHGTELINIPLLTRGRKKYFNEFPIDRNLVIKSVKAAQRNTHHSLRVTVKKGPFLTLSTCTGTKKRAAELESGYKAICENMEGAAIAHVCRMHDIPFIGIRGISNIVEKRDPKKWDIGLAAENCQMAVLQILKSMIET